MLRYINDSWETWAQMWRKQVDLGCIPYYAFVARDTGAKHFFEIPLERCWNIFRKAYSSVSGVCRTVRGPSMSDTPGKIQLLGVTEVKGEKVFVLRFLQGRNPRWVDIPFLQNMILKRLGSINLNRRSEKKNFSLRKIKSMWD